MRKMVVPILVLGVLGCTAKPLDTADLPAATLDELMALHMDPEAQVDRRVLRDDLRKQLESVSADELFSLRARANTKGDFFVDYVRPRLLDLIVRDSLVVHGRVREVAYDRDGLIRDILKRRVTDTAMTITVDVIGQFPPEPPCDAITYETSASWEYVDFVREGEEYVFPFVRRKGRTAGGGFLEVRRIEDSGVRFVTAYDAVSLDETWRLIEERFRTVTPIADDDIASRDAWMAKLRGDSLADTAAAVKVLTLRPCFACIPAL
ncbi:MAG TPA: hypothetical protein PLO37_06025 [Candidatus Hydrogenedentes bacterium]|nr:hypothetical protein [Candidatus Hydrogenedentota bacterium]HPG66387.1 hypothetical protein [Candidatus Hydrogenedentota bacterium]